MNRIDTLFKAKNNRILSVFFPAGYPQINDSVEILDELQKSGVDMVELGIPFSDPMADGTVIQNAYTRALKNGISLKMIFNQLKDFRNHISIPVILMGYLNPIMQYGFEKFCISCKETGIDGVIIPDLPFNEYIKDYKPLADKYGIKIIMLITPETSEDRIRFIDENTSGFIYMVSSASTTGAQKDFNNEKENYFRKINSMNLKNPRLIGFGVSNKSTFDSACEYSGGAIVGSHYVKLLSSGGIKNSVKELLSSLGLK